MRDCDATEDSRGRRTGFESSFRRPRLQAEAFRWGLLGALALLGLGCGKNTSTLQPAAGTDGDSTGDTSGSSDASMTPVSSNAQLPDPTASSLDNPTFWQDVEPVFNQKCVGCHQSGGIAPFALDNYADASLRANQIADITSARIMPPYLMETGGECGHFDESPALTDAQIELIGNWATQGAVEGTPVSLTRPPLPTLADAREWKTPLFTPQIVGGALAQFDEYRCFEIDLGLDHDTWVTGYEVVPGNAQMIHHVIGFLIDPDAPTDGGTNQEAIDALHAPTPDRDGWPCFGGAGDGINVESVPVTWAPGAGAVEYPNGVGIRAPQSRKLVVQVHYNLANPDLIGQSDQTVIRLQTADQVTRQGIFLLEDKLLASLDNPQPDTLPPGQDLAPYTWTASLGEMLGTPLPIPLDLVSVGAHMHQRGRKWTLQVGSGGDYSCIGRVDRWDFNWQRMYTYTTPVSVQSTDTFQLTCEYDTSADTEPVLPGWGTRNEMCLAELMFALPAGVFR